MKKRRRAYPHKWEKLTKSGDQKLSPAGAGESPLGVALNYLNRAIRASHQVQEKLTQSGFSQVEIAEVMVELRRLKYVNDDEYVAAVARTQLRSGHGKNYIWQFLRQKGFAAVALESIFQRVWPDLADLELEKCDEWTRLQQRRQSGNSYELRQKIWQRGMARGYRLDTLRQAWERIYPGL